MQLHLLIWHNRNLELHPEKAISPVNSQLPLGAGGLKPTDAFAAGLVSLGFHMGNR